MISIRLDGLEQFKRNARSVTRDMRASAAKVAKRTADDTLAWLHTHVMQRKLEFAPLSASWVVRKTPGQPPLVDTHSYINSMLVRPSDSSSYAVGVPSEYELRALWLEFGTSRMPARPHWRPAFDHALTVIGPRLGVEALHTWAKELAR